MNFGHHPDPAVDFSLEVDAIEGEITDRAAGLPVTMDLRARIERAMQFNVGGDAAAVCAKAELQKYQAAFKAAELKVEARSPLTDQRISDIARDLFSRNLDGEVVEWAAKSLDEMWVGEVAIPFARVIEREVSAPAAPSAGQAVDARVVISEYQIPSKKPLGTDHICIALARQLDGPAKWAVRRTGYCLNKQGEWEYEPLPSSRDDDFLLRCRFDSVEEAIAAASTKEPL